MRAILRANNINTYDDIVAAGFDKIKDVAVIGMPDSRLGEIAAAIIEFKEGYTCTEEEINEKKNKIEETRLTIEAAEKKEEELREEYLKNKETKEELSKKNKGFIEKRESITERLSKLAEEIVRLENRKEKITDQTDYKNNYMWENYELTLHAAKELKNEEFTDIDAIRKRIGELIVLVYRDIILLRLLYDLVRYKPLPRGYDLRRILIRIVFQRHRGFCLLFHLYLLCLPGLWQALRGDLHALGKFAAFLQLCCKCA